MDDTISPAACLYTLRELSRRAGVTRDDFARWRINTGRAAVSVRPSPDSVAEIRFPLFPINTNGRVATKKWAREAPSGVGELVRDFVVPFCRPDSPSGEALFRETTDGSFECTENLLGSALRTLSRSEELDSTERDGHGRFPASASIGWRHQFLHRPIVDEYGLALRQVLQILSPGWRPKDQRSLRVKLSHDIDELGIPFSVRSAAGHLLRRRAPAACARDFLSLVRVEPAYLKQVRDICRLSIDRGIRSAVYWKASPPGPFDTGYDPSCPAIARVIDELGEWGVEMGVHPGYDTYLSPARLAEEVENCRKALRRSRIGGRQHFLRWAPETWTDWENCGLAYDSSVGFADYAGFRAGTSVPYFPWLCMQDRMAGVLEIPLVVMDATLVSYMKLTPERSMEVVRNLMARCAAVGGVFTLLWHNTGLLPPYAAFYPPILDHLTGIENYDWESDAAEIRKFHAAA